MTEPEIEALAGQRGVVERCRPSTHGLMLGEALTALADAGRDVDPNCPDPCATCAFRPDCMTNMMAATGVEALNCAIGLDDAEFGCHHGMKDGEPTKPCAGWLAARQAPFETVKAEIGKLHARLAEMPDPDPIRVEFDAWVAGVDPDNQMDDYKRGRLWLRARTKP